MGLVVCGGYEEILNTKTMTPETSNFELLASLLVRITRAVESIESQLTGDTERLCNVSSQTQPEGTMVEVVCKYREGQWQELTTFLD